MINNISVNAIITAAGSGSRMNIDKSKQFLQIGDMTVLERTIRKFICSKYIDDIYIVAKLEDFDFIKNEILKDIKNKKSIKLIKGGSSREESTFCGISAIKDKNSLVVCHDSARPFVRTNLIDRVIEETLIHDAVITAVKEIDSVKKIKNGFVSQTLDRSEIFRIQTPQAFRYDLLEESYRKYYNTNGLTDDSSYVEKNGHNIYVVEGSYENIKITTKNDLLFAKALAKEEDNENW